MFANNKIALIVDLPDEDHVREVCRARGARAPPPQILVMIIKLIIGSNSGGSIKNYQHCTVYSLYCIL